jgi:hypothetical protein
MMPKIALLHLVALSLLCGSLEAQTPAPSRPKADTAAARIDRALVGVWGVDSNGGYEFRADGTFIMEGATTYHYDAANGTWHYWLPGMEAAKVSAEYQVSADGKALSINLKKGRPFTHLIRIR